MKLSAIFLVTDYIINTMKKMDEKQRLDYVLGIHNDQSFISNILDMEDLTDTLIDFYECLQKALSYPAELDQNNLQSLYKDQQTHIYLLSVVKLSKLIKHYRSKVNQPDELINNINQLFFNATNKNHYILLAFDVNRNYSYINL